MSVSVSTIKGVGAEGAFQDRDRQDVCPEPPWTGSRRVLEGPFGGDPGLNAKNPNPSIPPNNNSLQMRNRIQQRPCIRMRGRRENLL
jgi:hypothetical protein